VADERSADEERRSLVRAVRQHLESFTRAGLDRIPTPARREPTGASPSGQRKSLTRDHELPGSVDKVESHGLPPPDSFGLERLPTPLAGSAEFESIRGPSAGRTTSEHRALSPGPGLRSSIPDRTASASPVPVAASLFSSSEFDTPPVPACDRPALLGALAAQVSVCRKCPHLAETRTQTVFGTGSSATRLMFIGEAPGADEDRLGQPFVGRAGHLLTDMITKGMGLARDQVYIANILKCRPPENRTPTPEESDNCIGYLEEQIAIIRPEYLCLLGRVALQGLLRTSIAMGKARGKWYRYRGIPTIVTYHPSYLLRKPEFKREAWEDLQMLMKEMGLPGPDRKGRPDESAAL
jgi:uracil-DNA glycosylase family 4